MHPCITLLCNLCYLGMTGHNLWNGLDDHIPAKELSNQNCSWNWIRKGLGFLPKTWTKKYNHSFSPKIHFVREIYFLSSPKEATRVTELYQKIIIKIRFLKPYKLACLTSWVFTKKLTIQGNPITLNYAIYLWLIIENANAYFPVWSTCDMAIYISKPYFHHSMFPNQVIRLKNNYSAHWPLNKWDFFQSDHMHKQCPFVPKWHFSWIFLQFRKHQNSMKSRSAVAHKWIEIHCIKLQSIYLEIMSYSFEWTLYSWALTLL